MTKVEECLEDAQLVETSALPDSHPADLGDGKAEEDAAMDEEVLIHSEMLRKLL